MAKTLLTKNNVHRLSVELGMRDVYYTSDPGDGKGVRYVWNTRNYNGRGPRGAAEIVGYMFGRYVLADGPISEQTLDVIKDAKAKLGPEFQTYYKLGLDDREPDVPVRR